MPFNNSHMAYLDVGDRRGWGSRPPSSLAEVDVSADHLTGIVLRSRLQERGLEHLATNEKGRAPVHATSSEKPKARKAAWILPFSVGGTGFEPVTSWV